MNLSPGSTSGMSAVRTEENSTPVRTVQEDRTSSAANDTGYRHQPDGADPEHVTGDHDAAAREQVGEAGGQRAPVIGGR